MKIRTTELFEKINNSVIENKRYIFLRGSSRSGKSVTAIQYIIIQALTNPNSIITIARETQSSIKNTILMDFIEQMGSIGIFKPDKYNKNEMTYRYDNGSYIRFIGLDDTSGKLRGMKSDIVFIDEVNTIDKKAFIHLDIRCGKFILCAYNPEVELNWWGFEYENKENGIMLHSTWRQNPFLDERIVKSILELKEIDPEMYEIYSEGLIVERKEKVFRTPSICNEIPETKNKYIGIDWGYSNDECAVVLVVNKDKELYLKELIYRKGVTNEDLIFLLKDLGIDRTYNIVGDSAEPKSIQDLKRAGFNIRGVKKDSVLYGIQKMKQYKIFVEVGSENLMNEFEGYRFKKDRSGNLTNALQGNDHLLDGVRYVVTEFLAKAETMGKYSWMN